MLKTIAVQGFIDLDYTGFALPWGKVRNRLEGKSQISQTNSEPILRISPVQVAAWIMRPKAPGIINNAVYTEAIASPTSAPNQTIYGVGDKLYTVRVILDTAAYRDIHVRADNPDDAEQAARDVAVEEQGAHFELSEGNDVDHSNISINEDDINEVEPADNGDSPEP